MIATGRAVMASDCASTHQDASHFVRELNFVFIVAGDFVACSGSALHSGDNECRAYTRMARTTAAGGTGLDQLAESCRRVGISHGLFAWLSKVDVVETAAARI